MTQPSPKNLRVIVTGVQAVPKNVSAAVSQAQPAPFGCKATATNSSGRGGGR